MAEIYVSYDDPRTVEGPFISPEAADTYVYDIGCDDSDYRLLEASELSGNEEILAPHVQFLTVRIQINNLHESITPRGLVSAALSEYNKDQGSGATLYLTED